MVNPKYITLLDGMKIPTVGFGTWQIPDASIPETLDLALAAGYRSIDTAAIYGNEAGIGRAIKASIIPRAEIFIATKLWNTDQGYDATLRAIDSSLEKLQTDYVDLYLIHWPAPKLDKYVASWKALSRLRSEGLAKSIGVCNFTIEHLKRLMDETGIIPAINQIELHPFFQQKELREFHLLHNIVTEAWSPLAQGKFSNDILTDLGKKYFKTPAQIVLRWHFDNGIIAIPKSSNPSRILENHDIFNFKLTPDELDKISQLDDKKGRVGPNPMTADF